MSQPISDVQVLSEYLRAVMKRAAHHADSVDEIALAIVGAIVWRKDPADLKVREQDGDMKNVLWAKIGGQRYAFRYHHESGSIQVLEGSLQGTVLKSFDDSTPLADVKLFFEQL